MVTLLILCSALIGIPLLALAVYLCIPIEHPLRTESDYSHHTPVLWHLYYAHKYLRPMRHAEKNSGLEDYFQTLSFDFGEADGEASRRISIRAVGDLMARRDIVGPGGAHLWDEIGEETFKADLVTGNLEFAVNEECIYEQTVRYSVPPEQAGPLLGDPRFGSFDYVALANNHINDSLSEGIARTRSFLDEMGILHSGANATAAQQDEFPIIEVKGVRIALLSYSFSTNGIPLEQGEEFGVNHVRFNALRNEDYDPSLILRHIAIARQRGADYIISNHHFGLDHEAYPPTRIVERTHDLLEAGIDLVIGHHPHIVNPVDRYRTRDGRDCLVLYSLGSLTTVALPFAMQRMSLMAGIELECRPASDGSQVVTPCKVRLVPIYHSTNRKGRVTENRLLDINTGAHAIASGHVPAHYSKRDIHRVSYLAREYSHQFSQEGIEYPQRESRPPARDGAPRRSLTPSRIPWWNVLPDEESMGPMDPST
jgi:poly-gamma-glutamate synthesis protein (capsule biosynthesis protein)